MLLNPKIHSQLSIGGLFCHPVQQPFRGETAALQQPHPDKALRAVQPDLIILDICLPGRNGF